MIQAYQQNRNTQQNYGMQNPVTQTAMPQTQPQNNGMHIDLFSEIQGGERGAISTYVPNGQTAILFDTDSDCFFIKRIDQYGNVNFFKRYKYQVDESVSEFVSRKEFDELKATLDALRGTQSAETKEGE